MEETTNFSMESYKNSLDEALVSVMPSSWVGQTRMKVYDLAQERQLSEEETAFAIRLAERVHPKHPENHRTVANAAIRMTIDKLR